MNPIIKNILGLIAGWAVGMLVNMGIIMINMYLIPQPDGIDVSTMEGLSKAIVLYKPIHFVMPFLAHALGTLFGAFVATKIAASYQLILSMIIGLVFLWGGISMVQQLPSPLWFDALDLILAYIPMAFLGYKLALKKN